MANINDDDDDEETTILEGPTMLRLCVSIVVVVEKATNDPTHFHTNTRDDRSSPAVLLGLVAPHHTFLYDYTVYRILIDRGCCCCCCWFFSMFGTRLTLASYS